MRWFLLKVRFCWATEFGSNRSLWTSPDEMGSEAACKLEEVKKRNALLRLDKNAILTTIMEQGSHHLLIQDSYVVWLPESGVTGNVREQVAPRSHHRDSCRVIGVILFEFQTLLIPQLLQLPHQQFVKVREWLIPPRDWYLIQTRHSPIKREDILYDDCK